MLLGKSNEGDTNLKLEEKFLWAKKLINFSLASQAQAYWVEVEFEVFLILFELCGLQFGDDEKAELMGDIKEWNISHFLNMILMKFVLQKFQKFYVLFEFFSPKTEILKMCFINFSLRSSKLRV